MRQKKKRIYLTKQDSSNKHTYDKIRFATLVLRGKKIILWNSNFWQFSDINLALKDFVVLIFHLFFCYHSWV